MILARVDTMSRRTAVPTVRFEATLSTIDNSRILRLSEHASDKLPSRGQVAVQGTINGLEFRTVLEPDGTGGHWIKVDEELQHACGLRPGDSARLQIEPTRELAGAERATRSAGGSGKSPSKDSGRVEGHHANGTLGMGALGKCDQQP